MSQQVNLYLPVFRKQKRRFSAMAMLQATGLVVLGIGLLYGYTWWQVRQQRTELALTEKQFAGMNKRLDEVSRQFGERLQSKELQTQIQKLQQQVTERERLQQILQSAQFNTQGFSDYFVAFARQHIRGIWLTGLDITGAAEQLTLAGRSSNPELVPRYLQQLSTEKRLSGIEFRSFQMSRVTADAKAAGAPYIEFTVKTNGAGSTPVSVKTP